MLCFPVVLNLRIVVWDSAFVLWIVETVRDIHQKSRGRTDDLVTVPDTLRKQSPTFGARNTLYLGALWPWQLLVPPGHGRESHVRIESAMQTYRWDEIENEQLSGSISRQVIHADTMTLARISLKKGGSVLEHSHHNEQISTVERGALKFVLAGVEKVVGPGEILRIPPHVPHSVEALEDSVAVDLFSPRREDWIRGDDAYLRK